MPDHTHSNHRWRARLDCTRQIIAVPNTRLLLSGGEMNVLCASDIDTRSVVARFVLPTRAETANANRFVVAASKSELFPVIRCGVDSEPHFIPADNERVWTPDRLNAPPIQAMAYLPVCDRRSGILVTASHAHGGGGLQFWLVSPDIAGSSLSIHFDGAVAIPIPVAQPTAVPSSGVRFMHPVDGASRLVIIYGSNQAAILSLATREWERAWTIAEPIIDERHSSDSDDETPSSFLITGAFPLDRLL